MNKCSDNMMQCIVNISKYCLCKSQNSTYFYFKMKYCSRNMRIDKRVIFGLAEKRLGLIRSRRCSTFNFHPSKNKKHIMTSSILCLQVRMFTESYIKYYRSRAIL